MIKFDLTSFQCEDFTSRPSPRRTRSSPAVVLALPLAESSRTGNDTLWTSFPQLSTRPICFPSSILRDERCGSHGGEPTSKSLSNPCVVENRRAHPRKALGGAMLVCVKLPFDFKLVFPPIHQYFICNSILFHRIFLPSSCFSLLTTEVYLSKII